MLRSRDTISVKPLIEPNSYVVSAAELSRADLSFLPTNAVRVRLHLGRGFSRNLLDAMREVAPGVEAVNLIQGAPIDLNAFKGNEWLRSLSINGPYSGKLDVSSLPYLKSLMLYGSSSFSGFENAHRLESLLVFSAGRFITKWLNSISHPLRDLVVSRADLSQFCSESISRLVSLDLRSCRVGDTFFDCVSQPELDTIYLNGTSWSSWHKFIHQAHVLRIVLAADASSIESVLDLGSLPVEYLIMTGRCVVTDGRLKFLEKVGSLQDVWFMDRRHYDVKREALIAALRARTLGAAPPPPAHVWSLPGEF